ncbi:MAG: transposase [Vicinamibacterales bacterium]
MARPIGPKKVQRYSLEFKLKAVKLSQMPGVEVQAVADALEIHPFMLSRWRKEARDGRLRGRVAAPNTPAAPPAQAVKRYQALRRAHALLQEEHALLKKLIRFTSARKATSSRSSRKNGDDLA